MLNILLHQAESNDEMLEWIGVIQKLNDNQTLCNSLIKRKADELLQPVEERTVPDRRSKIKEYKMEEEFAVNSQYGSWWL